MGIYIEGDYTLIRISHAGSLYVQIQHRNVPCSTVSLTDSALTDSTIKALGFAWSVKTEIGTWLYNGLTLRTGYSNRRLVAHLSDQGGAVALVDADYLLLTGRLLKSDPVSNYEPVRHAVVSTGHVMLRYHKAIAADRCHRSQVAFRRVITAASDAMAVNEFFNVQSTGDRDGKCS